MGRSVMRDDDGFLFGVPINYGNENPIKIRAPTMTVAGAPFSQSMV
jgi:hypothetical protein